MVRFLHGGGVLSKVWFWRIDSNESTPTAASTFNYCWDTLPPLFKSRIGAEQEIVRTLPVRGVWTGELVLGVQEVGNLDGE